ncbi:LuxR C-terminal-related transcriptional regulator [Myroides sp. M-43]|uniref:LuxR C-terminal-related transcriptional regulator n=1 Tax=Myroides oncorhynchi TaxID=2893756 RepID=UPI001E2EC375|nr:LuxR C-terminal-related transcriptional regulator [Myroides oncorhynchi]MCC9044015.1 LuxR C-terminal-related transcriptional regulator [Myroides oncorhynchi]
MNISSFNEQWLDLYNRQNSKSKEKNKVSSTNELCTYFFIFDYNENTILFINSSFTKITGYNACEFNLNFLIDIIHPEDQNHFLEQEERGLEFTNNLRFNEHFRYLYRYNYRIKNAKGSYITISQECQALEVNESGHLSKTLVTHKVLRNDTSYKYCEYRVFDRINNVYLDLNKEYNLTNRELEVLTLIKEGLTSKQISNALNVSQNTILTHRKNILYKTSTNSFIELVKKLSFAD